MAYYGTDVFQDFSRKVFLPYGTYYSTANYNRLFKEATYNIINEIYKNLSHEKEYEKIRAHISIGYSATVTGNKISVSAVPNFDHLLALEVGIEAPETYIIVAAQTINGIIHVEFSEGSPLRTTEKIKLSNFMGLSGYFYVRQLTRTTYQIYSDSLLKVPATPLAPYTVGSVTRIVERWCKPYFSDRKIAKFGQPTIYFPKYEYGGNYINLYPENKVVTANIDYIQAGLSLIDVTNSTTDLLTYYTVEMINQISEEAGRLFKKELGDIPNAQVAEAELLKRN
jgi:hypothetical protein